jgi:hypothetical protein
MNCFRWLCLLILFCAPFPSWADIKIQSQTSIDITLTGFDGLKEIPLLQGNIAAGTQAKIDIPYRGLVLLGFAAGQSYPLIIGGEPFALQIANPGKRPTFSGSGENDYLYQSLAAGQPAANENYPFAQSLLRAKNLLESTYTIKTLAQLTAKKQELTNFVAQNYPSLRHSDMLRRFLNQSLMMHEYVDYHVEGEPTAAIPQRYEEEVLGGVGDWLKVFSPHISPNDIVNACVAFFYERSMVSMASLIIDRFADEAICPGTLGASFSVPENLSVTDAQGRPQGTLADIKGAKTIALVSDACPVSLAAAVVKARDLARREGATPLIVAPLQKLSSTYKNMARMIRGERVLFIDDETGFSRKGAIRPKLPLLLEVE